MTKENVFEKFGDFNTLLGLITVLKGLTGTNTLAYFGPALGDEREKKVFGESRGL